MAVAGGCLHPRKPIVLERPAGIIVEQRAAAQLWRLDDAATREALASAPRKRTARPPRSFQEAVAQFDLDAALKFAVVRRMRGDPAGGDAEQRLVEALQLAVAGRDDADSALTETMRASDDTLVRRVARLALTATLQYQGKWEKLATLPTAVGRAATYAANGGDVVGKAHGGGTAATAAAVARRADSAARASAPPTPFAAADSTGRAGIVQSVADDPDARAGVEAWAHAFRGAPGPKYEFPGRPVAVQLSLSPMGTPVVPVTVNGQEYLFWLDTGSSLTILSSDVAAAVGAAPLDADTLEVVTATGRVAAQPVVVSSFAIGALRVRDLPAVIVDAGTLALPVGEGQPMRRVDGIIGFDVIRRMDLELDYHYGRATIRRPAAPDARHPPTRNLFWLGYPMVRLVDAGGRSVHFALDTGADETYAALPLLAKTGVRTMLAERRRVSGFGQTLSVRGRVIPTLRLTLRDTPLRFERVFVYVVDYPTMFTLDGTLGGDVGAGGVVRIDMTNGIFEVGGRR